MKLSPKKSSGRINQTYPSNIQKMLLNKLYLHFGKGSRLKRIKWIYYYYYY
jgi:hypothetical protein